MKLSGTTAIVTGASRGIGKAIAMDLARHGAQVILTYKTKEKLAKEVVDDIRRKGAQAECAQLDVSSRISISQFAFWVKTEYQAVDIIVNNAGINRPNDFDQISDIDWDDIMNTNLKSIFMMGQVFLPLINQGGSVINIGSVSGQYGGPRTTHYCVSKAGIQALTQNMAIFFARKNIRVNTVSPGLIESAMAAAANSLGIDDKILLKRRGLPSEVASVVSFLASEEASYITAQTINVNGGIYF